MESSTPSPGLTHDDQLQRTVPRWRGLVPLLLACFMLVPQLSRGQTCGWEGFPEPSAGADVIEVFSHGGYGPLAGRTLVSVDASGRIALLARGQCPDRALVGRLTTPSFDELVGEFRGAVESVRGQPPRPIVSDDHPFAEIIREGRVEPLCQSSHDGLDLDVTLYRDGSKEQYTCVSGALLRFGEGVVKRVFDAICANHFTAVCVERMVDER